MENVKEKKEKRNAFSSSNGVSSNQYKPQEYERKHVLGNNQKKVKGKDESKFTKRIKRGAWCLWALVVIAFACSGTEESVNTSRKAKEALETHMSTSLAAGTRLLSNDGNYVGGDITITHNSLDAQTELYVWDYAAEDGDYVQIIVDGTPLGDPFMIKNKPIAFKIPTVGKVEIVGTRDGGGGITYAVYYKMNQTTYFNGVEEGGNNVYTLVRQ